MLFLLLATGARSLSGNMQHLKHNATVLNIELLVYLTLVQCAASRWHLCLQLLQRCQASVLQASPPCCGTALPLQAHCSYAVHGDTHVQRSVICTKLVLYMGPQGTRERFFTLVC
jgi:hypothetical protein